MPKNVRVTRSEHLAKVAHASHMAANHTEEA